MIAISVHLDGVTTTHKFTSDASRVILIGSDIKCMVRVLRLQPVHAKLAMRDGRWFAKVGDEDLDQPARLELGGVKIDFTYSAVASR